MKTGIAVTLGVVAIAVVAGLVYMVDIDQTQEARLPDVEVNVDGGQMPEFEADVGSIDLTTEETTIEVPEVEVTMEERTVTVPSLDITPPEDNTASN